VTAYPACARALAEDSATPVVRRELRTLLAYLETGSHKEAARVMAIAESTCRQRVSRLMARVGASNAAQAAWWLRRELAMELAEDFSAVVEDDNAL